MACKWLWCRNRPLSKNATHLAAYVRACCPSRVSRCLGGRASSRSDKNLLCARPPVLSAARVRGFRYPPRVRAGVPPRCHRQDPIGVGGARKRQRRRSQHKCSKYKMLRDNPEAICHCRRLSELPDQPGRYTVAMVVESPGIHGTHGFHCPILSAAASRSS